MYKIFLNWQCFYPIIQTNEQKLANKKSCFFRGWLLRSNPLHSNNANFTNSFFFILHKTIGYQKN
jgi:hypothetical protein